MKTIETIKQELGVESLREANLQWANLQWANLRESDLREADLREANLQWANLRESDLREANLREANLQWADLREANLQGANLQGATGNQREVISLQTLKYPITYTKDAIQIGCQQHSIEEWESFDDRAIRCMDEGALDWWKSHKAWLFKAIELNPAK
jgi:uncharacterized protein YjbI with pentapeptide repeats